MSRGFKNRVMDFFGGAIPYDPATSDLHRRGARRATRLRRRWCAGHLRRGPGGIPRDGAAAVRGGRGRVRHRPAVPIVPAAIVGSTFLWFRRQVEIRFGDPIPTAGIRGKVAAGGARGPGARRLRGTAAGQRAALPRCRPLRLLGDVLTGWRGPAATAHRARRVAKRRAMPSRLASSPCCRSIWSVFAVCAVGGFLMLAAYWLDIQDRPDLTFRRRVAWSAGTFLFPVTIPVYAFAAGPIGPPSCGSRPSCRPSPWRCSLASCWAVHLAPSDRRSPIARPAPTATSKRMVARHPARGIGSVTSPPRRLSSAHDDTDERRRRRPCLPARPRR